MLHKAEWSNVIAIRCESKKRYQKVGAWVNDSPIDEEAGEYALADVKHLEDLYLKLLGRLQSIGQLETFEKMESPIQQILPRLMERGAPLDVATWDTAVERLGKEARSLYKTALRVAPDHPRKGERKRPKSKTNLETWDWNFGSYNPRTQDENRQDALLALQMAGIEGLGDVRDSTLEAYLRDEGENELVQAILDYRQKLSQKGRMENFVKGAILGGRIYTQLHSYGTETGRITTSDAHLQGLDKTGEWREYLRDPKGESKILRADLDQIELRILARVVADATGDESLLSVYRDPLPDGSFEDLHTSTARTATGKKRITKKSPERTKSKATNFSIAYGAKPNMETKNYFDAFFERFPGVQEWQEEFGEIDDFWCTSLAGRKRFVDPYLTDGRYRRQGWPNREQRLNAPIQTTGTDIMKLAIIKMMETEPTFARLLFPAHDEAVIELLDPTKEEESIEWVTECMERAVVEILGEDLAKNVVDAKVARSWGEAA